MSAEIEAAIDDSEWNVARALIEAALADDPENHWLITRLGLTYYEQFDYEQAHQLSQKALRLAPSCPLALWDCAGALDMLKRFDEAIRYYQQLTDAGDNSIAFGDCGEGLDWARTLVADSHFRIADCYRKSNDFDAASIHYGRYLELRRRKWGSIYDESQAHRYLAQCRG